jgi:hypothetical protein
MSLSKLEEIVCPCGETFEAELWNAINPEEDPELKEVLLSGEVNIVCCPACGQIFYAEHFILYHDVPNEVLAFVYPTSFAQQATICAEKMNEDFQRAMGGLEQEKKLTYKPILLFGLDSLVDMIKVEEAISDEVSILQYSADELGISLLRMAPHAAREKQLPRVLPYVRDNDGDLREEIMLGLRKLLDYNENLSYYRALLESIESNVNWTLDRELFLK